MVMAIFLFGFVFDQVGIPYSPYSAGAPDVGTIMTVTYGLFGGFYLVLGALGIAGGIVALKKKAWGLALTGAIAACLTFFPVGIAATVYIGMARPEFLPDLPPI